MTLVLGPGCWQCYPIREEFDISFRPHIDISPTIITTQNNASIGGSDNDSDSNINDKGTISGDLLTPRSPLPNTQPGSCAEADQQKNHYCAPWAPGELSDSLQDFCKVMVIFGTSFDGGGTEYKILWDFYERP